VVVYLQRSALVSLSKLRLNNKGYHARILVVASVGCVIEHWILGYQYRVSTWIHLMESCISWITHPTFLCCGKGKRLCYWS